MAYWLMKSEPETWGWSHQVTAGTVPWEGVRGGEAQGYMRRMQAGDRVYFYHTGKEKAIVGVLEVARGPYPNPAEPKHVLVDVKPLGLLQRPVALSVLKSDTLFEHHPIARQPRLSVMPLTPEAWGRIDILGGGLQGGRV